MIQTKGDKGSWGYLNREGISIELNLNHQGTSLVLQWVRLHAPNAGAPVRSLVGELDSTCRNCVRMPQLRSPHATTKKSTCHN